MKYLFFLLLLLTPLGYGGAAKEKTDSLECSPHQLECADSSRCISSTSLCDFERDCDDGSDELNMELCKLLTSEPCTSGKMTCLNDKVQTGNRGSYRRYPTTTQAPDRLCTDIATACSTCSKPLNEKICKEVVKGKLKKQKKNHEFGWLLTSIFGMLNNHETTNSSTCPPFYIEAKKSCIFAFPPLKVSWWLAKQFCESMSGTLAIVSEVEDFKNVLDFLKERDLDSNFWLGGRPSLSQGSDAEEWRWLNRRKISMGAPFWALTDSKNSTSSKKQVRPLTSVGPDQCLSILSENSYYFSDENCDRKLSPICMAEL